MQNCRGVGPENKVYGFRVSLNRWHAEALGQLCSNSVLQWCLGSRSNHCIRGASGWFLGLVGFSLGKQINYLKVFIGPMANRKFMMAVWNIAVTGVCRVGINDSYFLPVRSFWQQYFRLPACIFVFTRVTWSILGGWIAFPMKVTRALYLHP